METPHSLQEQQKINIHCLRYICRYMDMYGYDFHIKVDVDFRSVKKSRMVKVLKLFGTDFKAKV